MKAEIWRKSLDNLVNSDKKLTEDVAYQKKTKNRTDSVESN